MLAGMLDTEAAMLKNLVGGSCSMQTDDVADFYKNLVGDAKGYDLWHVVCGLWYHGSRSGMKSIWRSQWHTGLAHHYGSSSPLQKRAFHVVESPSLRRVSYEQFWTNTRGQGPELKIAASRDAAWQLIRRLEGIDEGKSVASAPSNSATS